MIPCRARMLARDPSSMFTFSDLTHEGVQIFELMLEVRIEVVLGEESLEDPRMTMLVKALKFLN